LTVTGLATAIAARAATTAPSAAGVSVVAVRVGPHEFALDVMSVREIRGWSPPIPLPGAPAYVQGVSDLRGVVIPIIDLGARLGLQAAETGSTSVVVVAEIRGRLAGLLVDGVSDLIDIDPGRLQPTPETGSAEPGKIISGLFDIGGRILGLIAVDALIPADLIVAAAPSS
jgi:purine-binding chemotaxis protein CheW